MKSLLNSDTYWRLLTFAVFVLAGFDLSKSVPRLKAHYRLVAFVLLAAVLGYVAMNGRLISVLDYDVYVNEIILGLTVGLVIGLVNRIRPKFRMRS